MSAASLPYAVLILLVELAVGSMAFMTLFDGRGQVTSGYVKAGALTIVPLALLAAWASVSLTGIDQIEGYPLAARWLTPFRLALLGFIGAASVHLVAALKERYRAQVTLGAVASVLGVVTLALLAALVAEPTWSYAGMLVSLLAGAAVLGGALMAMMWGHWYLTSGRLPKEPMEQMSLLVLAALVVQAVVVVLAVLLPARVEGLTEASFGVGLGQNPAFWLRVGVGLLFPALLAVLAWKSAQIRGMMSATGLLYIALGAVLAGEVLARGLLFTTGLPV
ncbi:MAG: hypothetical protein GEU80_02300 [Dehalococcoidia bacterium]|nr:hypothetical protein [Dehalococcoidia bacterium]